MAEVTAALSACGKQDERIRTAEQLLNQKYGEEFSVTSYDGQEMMASYYEVTAYANEHPTLPFEASVNSDGSAVSDDYVSRRVCERISEQVALNLSALPCTSYVHTDIMSGDSVCSDPDVSIADFVSEWEPYNRYYIYVHLSEGDLDAGQAAGILAKSLSGLEMLKGNLSVYVSSDEMIAKVQDYVETHTGIYDSYSKLTDSALRGEYSFENGVIAADGSALEADLIGH